MSPADGQDGVSASRFAGGAAAATPTPEQDALRRDQAREALIGAALGDYPRRAGLADDGYSKQLRERAGQVSRYMQHETGSRQSGAYILDPNEFYAGVALGMDDKDVVRAMLDAHHVPATDKQVETAADSIRTGYEARIGGQSETQNPHAIVDYFTSQPQVCVIVPASSYFPQAFHIDGLTHQQNLDFIDGHESWHCKDTRNTMVGLDPNELAKLESQPDRMALGDPQALLMHSIANRQESLADVGSAGDMIRKGANPSIIGDVVAWRRDNTTGDDTHMTIASLDALERGIQHVGLDNFRHMNDAQAREFYNNIVAENALSPATAEKVIDYNTGDTARRAALQAEAATNPDTKRAMDALASYAAAPAVPAGTSPATPPLNPAEQATLQQLNAYDAGQLLQDRAFHDAHKITPQTLTRAYGEMQEDLRRRIDRDPDNALLQAQATKLQQSFVNTTQSLDYVTANAQRGVDIYKAEPGALRGLDRPSSLAPAGESPAAPQQNGAPRPDHRLDISQASPTPAADQAATATAKAAPRRPSPSM